MTPKTVICVIGSLNVGGAERHLVQVLPRLERSRWKPLVYCLTERGALADQLEASGVPVMCSSIEAPRSNASRPKRAARIVATMFQLSAAMRQLNPAIAHFFLPAAYILGAPAAWLARVPVRIMSRRSLNDYQKGHRFSAWIESRLHPGMTAILGNSRRVAEQLRDEEHVPLGKLGLIYNGIELIPRADRDVRCRVRAVLGIDPAALVFIIIANLIPYKGHKDLLEAFGRATSHLPQHWRLLVVGRDDGIGSDLRRQAELLGIAPNVMFLEARHDVNDLLRAADVNLLSSHQEGFSNSVLEGMAAGLPSIVTDVGGNAEAVLSGENGLVVPPHNPERFASAIEALAADPTARVAMGGSARLRVERNFALDACVARYDLLYNSLLEGRKPSEIETIRIE